MCSNRYPALPAMYRSTSTRAVQLATGLCHAFQESHFTRLRSARNPYLDPAGGEAEADIEEAIFGVTLAEQQKPGIDHGKLGPFSRAARPDFPRKAWLSLGRAAPTNRLLVLAPARPGKVRDGAPRILRKR